MRICLNFYLFVVCMFFGVVAMASPQGLPAPHPVHEKYDAGLGQADAREMIKSGQLTIIGAGLPPPCLYLAQKKIYKKYGIRWTVIGDFVSSDFEEYREAFNNVMIEHVTKLRGENFFVLIDRKISHEERIRCGKAR